MASLEGEDAAELLTQCALHVFALFTIHGGEVHWLYPQCRSAMSDSSSSRSRQSDIADNSLGSRIIERLAGRERVWLARESGISTSAISDYIGGKLPRADKAVELARALDTTVEWLFTGRQPVASVIAADRADFVLVDRFDLWEFRPNKKPPAIETIPIRRDWLYGSLRRTSGLWFADMPSDILPEIAQQSETIICEDPAPPLQERGVYVFLRDGEPLVRRVFYGPNGYILRAEGAEDLQIPRRGDVPPDEQLIPIARIVASYVVREV